MNTGNVRANQHRVMYHGRRDQIFVVTNVEATSLPDGSRARRFAYRDEWPQVMGVSASHSAAAQLTFQAVPFHRSIRVLVAPTSPTAQALPPDTAATPNRA